MAKKIIFSCFYDNRNGYRVEDVVYETFDEAKAWLKTADKQGYERTDSYIEVRIVEDDDLVLPYDSAEEAA